MTSGGNNEFLSLLSQRLLSYEGGETIKIQTRKDDPIDRAYLFRSETWKLALLQIRPVVAEVDVRDAQYVADEIPIHVIGPGDALHADGSLFGRRGLFVRVALDGGRGGCFGHDAERQEVGSLARERTAEIDFPNHHIRNNNGGLGWLLVRAWRLRLLGML